MNLNAVSPVKHITADTPFQLSISYLHPNCIGPLRQVLKMSGCSYFLVTSISNTARGASTCVILFLLDHVHRLRSGMHVQTELAIERGEGGRGEPPCNQIAYRYAAAILKS